MSEEQKEPQPTQNPEDLEKVPVKRDETAPAQPDPEPVSPEPDAERLVNLPRVLADEFGISAQEARQMIQGGTVEIDGETLERNVFSVPHERVYKKTIKVSGDAKQYQFEYKVEEEDVPGLGEQHDRRR